MRAGSYACREFVALLLEKACEARHEYGGFSAGLTNICQHRDMPHIWANTLCIGGALLAYNFLVLLSRHLGSAGLRKMLSSPPTQTGHH